jgi:hypothetical protein
MHSEECEGWFFRRDDKTIGPLSAQDLQGLLDAGQIQPRQAVWRRQALSSLFVRAETAVRAMLQQTKSAVLVSYSA